MLERLILKPAMVIAPHLVFPEINGADISLERVARYLSQHAPFVDLIGCSSIRRYRGTEIEKEELFTNQLRSRPQAAIRTLLFRTHYLYERFNTPAIRRVISGQMIKEEYGVVLASYLVTAPLLPHLAPSQKCFIWTHNDEFKWFEDLKNSTRNLAGKAVSHLSLQWLYREVPRLASRAVFIHVSEKDRVGFEQFVPDHRHLVVSIGTDIDPIVNENQVLEPEKIIISFIGSLGVQMAFDALRHFHNNFEPELRASFGAKLIVQIVGSNPLQAVRDLCRKAEWQLFENVSDAVFSQILAQSTFTMLPFAYVTGAKLKLVRTLGSGVPFLSTLAARPPDFPTPPGCCFSDDPQDWVKAVRSWKSQNAVGPARRKLLTVAEGYSWRVVVGKMAQAIQQFSPENKTTNL
jgi:hypothetical protein